jgi:hypothetical protein
MLTGWVSGFMPIASVCTDTARTFTLNTNLKGQSHEKVFEIMT